MSGVIPTPTLTQQRRWDASAPKPKKRLKATICQPYEASGWSVSIDAPGWGDDPDFDDPDFNTCDEAYQYIAKWARDRDVRCEVTFAYLAGGSS